MTDQIKIQGGSNLKFKKIFVLILVFVSCLGFATIKTTDITMAFEGTFEGTVTIPYYFNLENLPTEDHINEEIMGDLRPFIRELSSWADEAEADFKKEGWTFRPYEIYVDYNTQHTDNNFLSFYINYYQYTGGAHGMTFKTAYNYDLRTGKKVFLDELFERRFDYKSIIIKKINEKIAAEPDLYFIESLDNIERDVDYYVTRDSLVVYFQLYDIAPYYVGFPSFEIPLIELSDGLILNLLPEEKE